MPTIVLFNGPPRCGKDTAAVAVHEYTMVRSRASKTVDTALERFSLPIKLAFGSTFAVRDMDGYGVSPYWETIKDTPQELLGGKTYRQWQIDFSEKFMKPLYGNDIFGRLFFERMENLRTQGFTPSFLIADAGFQVEADYLATHMARWVDQYKIVLFRIHRNGCTFDGDSRSYIDGPPGSSVYDIDNNVGKHGFTGAVLDALIGEGFWDAE